MNDSVFSPEALEANQRGHLSPTQKRELQAYVNSLPRAFMSRLLFGPMGTQDKELRADKVLLFEGVTVRKEWEPEDKEYQIEAASRQEGFKTFWSLEDLYNFAPEKGLVRMYYLPRTRWAVNLQRLPGRPLTRKDLEPGLLRQRALDAADRRRTPDPVERAYLAADVEAAHREFRSYLPGGAPLPALSGRAADPRSLAASLAGRWWNPGLTVDLRADGTVTIAGPWVAVLAGAPTRGGSGRRSRAGTQSGPTTRSGTWSVGADGRLQTDATGTPLVADAVVAGSELTLVIDGNPWRFER